MPLVISYKSTAGNDRRADIEALLKQKAIPAGFQFDVKNEDPSGASALEESQA